MSIWEHAYEGNEVSLISYLEEHPEDVNLAYRTNEETPLHKSAISGHLGCLKILIERGGDVNVLDEDGATPLHFASLMGHVGCAAYLLECGAKIDMLTAKGQSPLHHACSSYASNVETVALLLKVGHSSNIKDFSGKTPLMLAIELNLNSIMDFLFNK